MEYRRLGTTGVHVSELCFGTMTFGGDADLATSKEIFKQCREAGINFFDCANVYAEGESERILGDLIADCRDEMVITSKVFGPIGKDINAKGLSRRHIMRAIEASLKNLKTDRLDIYFLHHFSDNTPLEETLRALEDLVAQGKILYAGASNFAAWQVVKSLGLCEQKGWHPFKCIQPMYSLLKRQAEVEILPMAQSENLGVISYSPMGAGLLSGKYLDKTTKQTGRMTTNSMYQKRYSNHWINKAIEGYVNFAKDNGYDPASLAIAWVLKHPGITCPIIGARNLKQLDGCLKATEIKMDDALYEQLSSFFPTPPPANDRSEVHVK